MVGPPPALNPASYMNQHYKGVLKISICSHICNIAPEQVQYSLWRGSKKKSKKSGHSNKDMQKCSGKLSVQGTRRREESCKFFYWAVDAILLPKPSVKPHTVWPPVSLRVQVNEIFGPIERFQHAPQLTPFNHHLFWCSKVGIHYVDDKYHPHDTNGASVSCQLIVGWIKCIWLTERKGPLLLKSFIKNVNI